MDSSTPWDVSATRDSLAGYTQTMCVSCMNGPQTIQIDNWSVSLDPCTPSTFTTPSKIPDAVSLSYNSTDMDEII